MAGSRRPLAGAVTGVVLLFLYAPLAMVVLFSFSKTTSLTFPFHGFSLTWYQQTLSSNDFQSAVKNSLTVALPVAVLTLVFGTMAAYGLTHMPRRLRAAFSVLFFTGVTLPGLVLGIALLTFFARIKVELSLSTVIVAHLVFVFPFFMLVAVGTLNRLDPTLEELAADLGASPFRTFWRVTLPQIWPILVAASCLAFMLSFDEFIITFFVIGPESTIPLYLFSSLHRTATPGINVISTLLLTLSFVMASSAALLGLRAERRRQSAAAAFAAPGVAEGGFFAEVAAS